MTDAIQTLRSRFPAQELAGIGVSVPGFIQMKEGVIRNSNNLSSLENFPIRDELSRRLGAPVILENDANAAALGEKWIRAGRGVNDLVLLTLGTGVWRHYRQWKNSARLPWHGGRTRPYHRGS